MLISKIISRPEPNNITFRITPERSIRNYNILPILNQITDLHRPLLKRIGLNGPRIEYRLESCSYFDVVYRKDSVVFYLTVPEASATLIQQKINLAWENSAIEIDTIDPLPHGHCIIGGELRYLRHDVFSIASDRRDNDPLTSQLALIDGLRDDDIVRINVEMTPQDRRDWQCKADDASQLIRRGGIPSKNPILCQGLKNMIFKSIEWTFREIATFLAESIEGKEIEIRAPESRELEMILENGKLSPSSKYKLGSNVFKTNVTILSSSKSIDLARSNLKLASDAYRDLNEDNELYLKEITGRGLERRIRDIEQQVKHRAWDVPTLSSKEVGKLIQLPPGGLQEMYPQIAAIRTKELKVPELVFDESGIPFGEYTYRRLTRTVHIPLNKRDESCLLRIVIAGMGQGKTEGYAANFAVEAFLKGKSVITIDCAKYQIRDQIARTIPPELWDRVHFLDLSDIDYPIGLDWSEALMYSNRISASRLGSELGYFFKKNMDPAGDRTRKYLELASQTVSLNSSSNPLDIMMCLVNPEFRRALCKKIRHKPMIIRDWNDFDDMSSAKRREIYDPVLYRLNMLLGSEPTRNILCQEPKGTLDLRKLMDGGNLIVVDARKSILGRQGIRDIISYLMAKIWLTALTRGEDNSKLETFLVLDEPQQWLGGSTYHFEEMVTESRKWGLGLVFLFHSWAQLKKESRELVDIMQASIPHYHIYSTSMTELKSMKEVIHPYTPQEAFESIHTHSAINKLWVNGGYHTFIAKMIPPPSKRYPNIDMTERIMACRGIYGRHYKEVEGYINNRTRSLISSTGNQTATKRRR